MDVDGTIITKDHLEASELNGFLKYLFNTGEIYWSPTHCRYENTSSAISYIKPFLNPKNNDQKKKFFSMKWNTLKIKVINFSQPFYWFDDYLLEVEKKILLEKWCLEKWIKIDLGYNKNI